MAWATDPILNLFDVSGYCILMAELNRNPSTWDICREVWEQYLQSVDAKEALQTMAAVVRFDETLLGTLRPRAILRTQWKMMIDGKLEGVPTKYERGGFLPQAVPDHESSLVRTMATDSPMGSPYDGVDISVELYLMNLQDAAGIVFRRRPHLTESLEHRDEDASELSELVGRVVGQS